MRTKTKEVMRQTFAIAIVLLVAAAGSAIAQDTIGVTPVETAVIATLKIVAIAMIGWGFMRLMAGRHTVEALFCLAIGGLGLGKTAAIVALLGVTTRAVPRFTLLWTYQERRPMRRLWQVVPASRLALLPS